MKNRSPAMSARKTGDWNWNPQLKCAAAGEFEDAVELRRICGHARVLCEVEHKAPSSGRDLLRSGIGENVLVGGKKRGGRFAMAGFDAEAKTFRRGLKDGLDAGGEWRWQGAGQTLDQSRIFT